ncbi:MAG: lysylphosphatidylglycerol synthase transmembrane domain-containing protein [Thermoleophilaceae bacterium]
MNRRFALLQAVFSVVALAAVVWWASHQPAPSFPHTSRAIIEMVAAALLYAAATVIRAERWHSILSITGVKAARRDCYGLTTVGYMGNNVLPARAGELLRVVLLDQKVKAGKRTLLGTVVAERILDLLVLAAMLLVVGYGVLKGHALPSQTFAHPAILAAAGLVLVALAGVGFLLLKRRGLLERVRDAARPLAGAPRALWGKPAIPMLAATVLLWSIEGSVYLFVAKSVNLDISASGALYLVGLTNFVAALPAAPGSIGTFDAAVAFGARVLGGSGSAVVSYVILLRFVLYVPITVVGLTVLVVRYGGWARLRSAASLQTSRA